MVRLTWRRREMLAAYSRPRDVLSASREAGVMYSTGRHITKWLVAHGLVEQVGEQYVARHPK